MWNVVLRDEQLRAEALGALRDSNPGLEPKLDGWELWVSPGRVEVKAVGRVWAAVPYHGGKWVGTSGARVIPGREA